jgi:hypothetical protein
MAVLAGALQRLRSEMALTAHRISAAQAAFEPQFCALAQRWKFHDPMKGTRPHEGDATPCKGQKRAPLQTGIKPQEPESEAHRNTYFGALFVDISRTKSRFQPQGLTREIM